MQITPFTLPAKSAFSASLLRRVTLMTLIGASSLMAQAVLPTLDPVLNKINTLENTLRLQTTTAGKMSTPMSLNPLSVSAADIPALNTANMSLQTKTIAVVIGRDAQGQTTLQPVDANTRIQAGDVLEYRTYVTNNSPSRVSSMTITSNIPAEVALQGAVTPSTASASLDGRAYNLMPLRGRIDGQLQDIPLQYYKSLRWTLTDLDIGETATVSYRAVAR